MEGELLEYQSYGGSGSDLAYQILLLENNEKLLIGTSESSDFDVPENQGEKDIFLIKLASTTSGDKDIEQTAKIVIYPNPTRESINLEIPSEFLEGKVILYNSIGQKISERNTKTVNETINLNSLENGIYFLEFSNIVNGEKILKKVIKENNDH